MNIIHEKLVKTHRFATIDQSIFIGKESYITKKISMVVGGLSDYGFSGVNHKSEAELLVDHLHSQFLNTLYKFLIDNIGGTFENSVIEKVLEFPRPYNEYPSYRNDYYEPNIYNTRNPVHNIGVHSVHIPQNMSIGEYDMNMAYNNDGYVIIDHLPIVIWSLDITEMCGYITPDPTDSMYYNDVNVKSYEITCDLSIPDNIKIYKILSDKDEIKLFKRQKAIEKITKNIKNRT